MPISYRPRNHTERDQIVAGLTHYLGSADPNPTLVALDAAFFATARATFVACRDASLRASSAARVAAAGLAVAGDRFHTALRLFAGSARDENGHATPRVLAELLGGVLPSRMHRRSFHEEVHRARGLLTRLEERPDLRCSAELTEGLREHTEALAAALRALEVAARALAAATDALVDAGDAFDQSYSRLVRAALVMVDARAVRLALPRFARREGLGAGEEGEVLWAAGRGGQCV